MNDPSSAGQQQDMKHYLLNTGSVTDDTTILSQSEYDSIVRSKEYLLEIWAFERRFAFLIENYLDFEKLLLNYSVEDCVESIHTKKDWSDKLLHAERMLTNFLSSIKRYVDHGKTRVRRSDEFAQEDEEIYKSMISNIENNSLEYRTASAIRNVAQHADTVISQLAFGNSRQDHGGIAYFEKAVIPTVDFNELSNLATRKNDKEDLAEICEMGVSDARVICRLAIKCVGKVHTDFMSRIREQDEIHISNIESVHSQFENKFGKIGPGLAAIADPGPNENSEIHYLSKRIIEGFIETKTRYNVERLDITYACNHPIPSSRSFDHSIPPLK